MDIEIRDEIDQGTQEDPAVLLRAAAALHRLAERVEVRGARLATARGWTWAQIGDALGVSRQSAHQKHGRSGGAS